MIILVNAEGSAYKVVEREETARVWEARGYARLPAPAPKTAVVKTAPKSKKD